MPIKLLAAKHAFDGAAGYPRETVRDKRSQRMHGEVFFPWAECWAGGLPLLFYSIPPALILYLPYYVIGTAQDRFPLHTSRAPSRGRRARAKDIRASSPKGTACLARDLVYYAYYAQYKSQFEL